MHTHGFNLGCLTRYLPGSQNGVASCALYHSEGLLGARVHILVGVEPPRQLQGLLTLAP